ncbi:MAG: ABC transporter ATP-binding protein [Magnetococcales bacterium]|nr:ABC transporter ATP-binding protein [Magnetococcales bacterium]
MNDELVRVENVSKKFCRDLRRSLHYGITDMMRAVRGQAREHRLRTDEFWAIQDVSFSLKRGEIVGIIGPNGAGKTTLLRLINGLILPDQGRIHLRGRIGALIQLGAGFSPILSGRENIFVNAAILGMSKSEIHHRLDQIIEFADIGEFIDSPVQSYSSGMRARLGFAVAIHMNPDILLVDEILAVGDMIFRNKAMARMQQLAQSGMAIIFISHNLDQVDRLCTRAIFFKSGQCVADGPTREIITRYVAAFTPQVKGAQYLHHPGTEQTLWVEQVSLHNDAGEAIQQLESCAPLILRMTFEAKVDLEAPIFFFMIEAPARQVIAAIITQSSDHGERPSFLRGRHTLEARISHLSLLPGHYTFRASVFKKGKVEMIGRISQLANLQIIPHSQQSIISNENVFVELASSWQALEPCHPDEQRNMKQERV